MKAQYERRVACEFFWSARHWHTIVITRNVKVVRKRNVKDVLLVVLLWSARHWHMIVITSNVKVV